MITFIILNNQQHSTQSEAWIFKDKERHAKSANKQTNKHMLSSQQKQETEIRISIINCCCFASQTGQTGLVKCILWMADEQNVRARGAMRISKWIVQVYINNSQELSDPHELSLYWRLQGREWELLDVLL